MQANRLQLEMDIAYRMIPNMHEECKRDGGGDCTIGRNTHTAGELFESQWTNSKYKNDAKTYSIIIQMISSTVCCIPISSVTWQSSGLYPYRSFKRMMSVCYISSTGAAGPFHCRYILFISFSGTGMQCSTLPAIDPSDINASCQTQGFTIDELMNAFSRISIMMH